MIDHLKVQNLLSLRGLAITLPKFGVLVGPNGAGKSNLFRVLEQLKQPSTSWIPSMRSWRSTGNVMIEVTASVPPAQYLLETDQSGVVVRESFTRTNSQGGVFARDRGASFAGEPLAAQAIALRALAARGDETSREMCDLFESIRVFEFDPVALRQPAIVERTLEIGRRGGGLPAVLDTLREEHPAAFSALEEALRSTIPGFKQLALVTEGQGTKSLGYHETEGLIRAESASDGTLLLLAILTAVHLPRPPQVLCLEEPERGVHPRRLADLVAFLWSVVERGTQILVATHSPYLLDCFRDDRDCLIVVDRTADGSRFRALAELGLSPEQLDAPLGEVWYSGILGGVPGS